LAFHQYEFLDSSYAAFEVTAERLSKGRDADHLTKMVYDRQAIETATLEADLNAARDSQEPATSVRRQNGGCRGR